MSLPDREPYETDTSICAAGISEGDTVDVYAAPHNKKRVTIDVGQGSATKGADTRARAAARTSTANLDATMLRMSGASSASPDPADEIAKLAEVRDKGDLSAEEFEAQKRKVLGD